MMVTLFDQTLPVRSGSEYRVGDMFPEVKENWEFWALFMDWVKQHAGLLSFLSLAALAMHMLAWFVGVCVRLRAIRKNKGGCCAVLSVFFPSIFLEVIAHLVNRAAGDEAA